MKTKFYYGFFSTLVVLVITFSSAEQKTGRLASNNLISADQNMANRIPDQGVWLVSTRSSDYVNGITLADESPGPDLIPIIPPTGNWQYPLVVSQVLGDHLADNSLSTSAPVYFDFSYQNQGSATSQVFTTCILINDLPANCWKKYGIGENEMYFVNDFQLPLNFIPQAGLSQIELVIDIYDDVNEVDETNNVFPQPTSPVPETLPYQYAWSIPPVVDLLPAIPEDWIYPIQPSSTANSHIPGPLFAGQDTYVSVAVQNLSLAQSAPFSACLFIDASDSSQHCWNLDSGLLSEEVIILETVLNSELITTPGQHLIKLAIDPDNQVQEAYEENNIWSRSYYWQEAGTCSLSASSEPAQSIKNPESLLTQKPFVQTIPALHSEPIGLSTIQQRNPIKHYRLARELNSADPIQLKTATTPPVLATATSNSRWQPILYEDFEGSFPEDNGWSLVNTTPALCEYLWDSDTTRYAPPNGSHSGWPARGGRNGLSPDGSSYPPNTQSWMVYGPFSLENASDAHLTFDLWRDLELPYDFLFAGASSDGENFFGMTYSSEGKWAKKKIELDHFTGSALVWIAFLFTSDPSGQGNGPWVDNILVEQEIKPIQVYLPLISR